MPPDPSDIEIALQDCASEAVHIPGSIQANGGLIAVHSQTLAIDYVSANIADYLKLAPKQILGKPLGDVVSRTDRHALINGMMLKEIGLKVNELGLVEIAEQPMMLTSAQSDDHTIFELELVQTTSVTDPKTLRDLEFLTSKAQAAKSEDELYRQSVHLLQILSGYDRVMIYQFDNEGNGKILAEAAVAGLARFEGLSFPAHDIPEQARQIMKQTAFRYIADTGADPVPVLAAREALPPLDMTHAHLRGTSPVHREYLRNMKTGATFTLNIVLKDQLWGIISFHHLTPRYPDQRLRQMCRNFADFFTLKLSNLLMQSQMDLLHKSDEIRSKIFYPETSPNLEVAFEADLLRQLSETLQADGAAVVFKGTVVSTGLTPEKRDLDRVLQHVEFEPGIKASSCLATEFPEIAGICGRDIAGMMIAKLPEDCTFIFFRRDRRATVTWAGAPDKNIYKDGVRTRLRPRASFDAYVEQISGTSAPWTMDQTRMAEELWTMLVTAERADLIEKSNRQQSLVIDELNHRVRNILALIRSLSRQTLSHDGSIQSYVSALEARISAVATAHDLGASKSNLSATVMQILELEAQPYDQDNSRILISGDDVGIRADLAPMLALVIDELVTNAVKYGALSSKTGQILVALKKTETGFEINWQEAGGPPVNAPKRNGFGTTLIETSVPFELDGDIDISYHPDGLRTHIILPNHVLDLKVPLRRMKDPEAETTARVDILEKAAITQQPCLLVEDNYMVSLDTQHVLKSIGFETIDTARNVADALEKIARHPPGIAILDINLSNGETSGPIALMLRKRRIPFVFVSGYGDTLRLDKIFATSPVLKKPIQAEKLRNLLVEVSK